jgi:hypothetical protein
MRFLILILSLTLLSACGRYAETLNRLNPAGMTEVKFASPRVQNERGEIMSFATLNGGVMVYAVNANEQQRRGGKKLQNETDGGTSWSIPTASYFFYGIGYQGANLTGTMHCGQTGPINLNGTPMTIQITLDQNNCGTLPFTDPTFSIGGNQPQPLMIANCGPSSAVASGACSTASTSPTMQSANASLPEYWGFDGEVVVANGPGNSLQSGCATANNSGTPTTTGGSKIPTGGNSPGDPFVVGFNSYDTTGCSGETIKELFGLGRGLSNFGNMNFSRFELNGNPVNPGQNKVDLVTFSLSMRVLLRNL